MEKVLQILSASLAPITAISAIIIAWRQHTLEKSKFRQLLYEKRYAVFNSTIVLLSTVIREADLKLESLIKFIQETNQAYFLFGDGIANYLDEIYKKGVDLQAQNKVINGTVNMGDTERNKLIEKNKDLLLWFGDQMTVCRQKFGEHLMLK
jgi:hypothetical protein